MIARTSGEMFLPSDAARSIEPRTLRTSASTSSEFSGASGSEIGVTLAFDVVAAAASIESTRQRESPWIRMRMRPSGSFSIRMMIATVPTRIEIVLLRLFLVHVLLRDEQDHPVFLSALLRPPGSIGHARQTAARS